MKPYLKKKQLKSKRTRDVTQEIEHLPGKHEALSSIPSTAKRNKQEWLLLSFIIFLTMQYF
jgi:predicted ATPase